MQLETVIYKKEEGIITISLNRPEVLNAVDRQLASDLLEAFQAAEADAEAKVIILKGEGRAFSAGLDLTEKPPEAPALVEERHDIMDRVAKIMMATDKMIIAAVHGYAIGYGLELVRRTRLRIVAEGTRFASKIPNDFVDDDEALARGIAGKLVPLSDLDKTTMDIARKVSALQSAET